LKGTLSLARLIGVTDCLRLAAALTVVQIALSAQTFPPGAGGLGPAVAGVPQESPPREIPNPIEDRRDRIYYPGDTESIKPLSRKLGGNILLDQKDIWTSPFHMNRHNAKWWILFGGAAAGLVVGDHYTQHRIDHSPGQVSVGDNISRAGAVYVVLPEVAAFYSVGVVADKETARETGVLGAEALLDSLIVSEVLKTAAGRRRPDSATEPSEFFDSGASFPSGHAIESWALASVIASEYHAKPWVPFVAYGLAGAVSVSRYVANRHYASDLVTGAAMGWFIGRYVYHTHMDHAIHRHPAAAAPFIMPEIEPGTKTYSLALVWGR